MILKGRTEKGRKGDGRVRKRETGDDKGREEDKWGQEKRNRKMRNDK